LLIVAASVSITIFGAKSMASSSHVNAPTTNRNAWVWDFMPQAKDWNGRLAMLGFVSVVLIAVFSSQGVLHFWWLLPVSHPG
jgi:hypothetical protein